MGSGMRDTLLTMFSINRGRLVGQPVHVNMHSTAKLNCGLRILAVHGSRNVSETCERVP